MWATVLVAVIASAFVTAALSWLLTGVPAGWVAYTISTVAAASISFVATSERLRHVRALEAAHAALRAQVLEVERLHDVLHAQARRDPLTEAFNRRVLHEVAPPLLERAARDDTWVSLVFLDVDHFKEINDAHGHAVGDAVLVALARHLQSGVRAADVVVRYGGEEFALLLPGVDAAGAVARFGVLRRSWRPVADPLRPTLSAGVAAAPDHALDLEGLMHAADDALYRAKQLGRDQVVVASARP